MLGCNFSSKLAMEEVFHEFVSCSGNVDAAATPDDSRRLGTPGRLEPQSQQELPEQRTAVDVCLIAVAANMLVNA